MYDTFLESVGPGHHLQLYFRWFGHNQDDQEAQKHPTMGFFTDFLGLDYVLSLNSGKWYLTKVVIKLKGANCCSYNLAYNQGQINPNLSKEVPSHELAQISQTHTN